MSTSFFSRLKMASKLLFGGEQATALPVPTQAAKEPVAEQAAGNTAQITPLTAANTDGALQLLALLQQEARLIDFVQEEITAYDDAQVGAAARVIHQGLRKVIEEHLTLAPISTETEGGAVSLPSDFDAQSWRLTGNIHGDGPYSGALIHKGWKAEQIQLPQTVPGYDFSIIAPAEVEL